MKKQKCTLFITGAAGRKKKKTRVGGIRRKMATFSTNYLFKWIEVGILSNNGQKQEF